MVRFGNGESVLNSKILEIINWETQTIICTIIISLVIQDQRTNFADIKLERNFC